VSRVITPDFEGRLFNLLIFLAAQIGEEEKSVAESVI